MSELTFVLDGGMQGGGAERVASNMLNYWAKNGHAVSLLTVTEPVDDAYFIDSAVHRIHVKPITQKTNFIFKIFEHLTFILKLRSAIKSDKSDVVLSFVIYSNIRTIFACIGLKKKIIISERSATLGRSYGLLWSTLRFVMYRFADTVTANALHSIDGMKTYVPSNKMVYIPNMINLPVFVSTPNNTNKIITVGRVVQIKSQDLLIKALGSKLLRNKLNWELDIYGEGDQIDRLVSLTEFLSISDNVSFHGFVSSINEVYAQSDIFVITSEHEGFPNALLEAMSHGLACIVPDNLLFTKELIVNECNGLLFSGGDEYSLASKLSLLINNHNLRDKLGKEARKSLSCFSESAVMDKWNEVLSLY